GNVMINSALSIPERFLFRLRSHPVFTESTRCIARPVSK
ncbi:MAG: hypothetical protein ACI8P0_004120, partial [Planctomycetaceae bacterium]